MVVDSSVWIELIARGPLASACEKAVSRESLKVPALVIHEVYKKLKSKSSDDVALEAVAHLSQHEVLEFDRDVALLAADLCLEHRLSMADGIVLAHALALDETLLTLDNDFAELPGVRIVRS